MVIKVVHWGTGPTGSLGLRGVLNHPDLELVGLYVHSPEKVGRDAGDLCGLPATGVVATDDAARLRALGADCLTYFGPGAGREDEAAQDVLPFLAAGVDVVTTSFAGLTHPPASRAALRDPFAAAAAEGGASFFATGIEPGFASDILPLALLSACDDLRSVRIQEIADYGTYPGELALRYGFGFAEKPDFPAHLAAPEALVGGWRGVVDVLGAALGVTFDSIGTVYERAVAERDIETAIGTVSAGTTAGVRFEVQGKVGDHPLVVLEHVNRMADDVAPDWPHGNAGDVLTYVVEIEGRPTMRCELTFAAPEQDHGLTATAMRAVNAVPAVCAAAPGLLSAVDLPPVAGRHLV